MSEKLTLFGVTICCEFWIILVQTDEKSKKLEKRNLKLLKKKELIVFTELDCFKIQQLKQTENKNFAQRASVEKQAFK